MRLILIIETENFTSAINLFVFRYSSVNKHSSRRSKIPLLCLVLDNEKTSSSGELGVLVLNVYLST